jgi:hypothetical protein
MSMDPKMVAQMLDLSRNVEKLTGELKKNTSVTGDLVKTQENIEENKSGDKSQAGDKKLLESLKGLDFNIIKDTLGNLNDSIKKIDKIDFKNLGDAVKSLDPKKFEESFKQLGSLKDIGKNLISGDIGKLDIGSLKDSIGGALPKIGGDLFGKIGKKGGLGGILGGFKDGGDVNFPGKYVVGEAGPEILELDKGDKVIPNKDIQSFIEGRMPDLQKRKTPTKEEIEQKKQSLLSEDPAFYSDPAELADEIQHFIDTYDQRMKAENDTFTLEDIKKLGTPTKKEQSPLEIPLKDEKTKEILKNQATESLKKVNEEKLKEQESPKKSAFKDLFSSDMLSKGSDILKKLPIDKNISVSEIGGLLNKPTDLLKKFDSGKIQDSFKGLFGNKTTGIAEKKEEILKSPTNEIKKNIPLLKDQPAQKSNVEQPLSTPSSQSLSDISNVQSLSAPAPSPTGLSSTEQPSSSQNTTNAKTEGSQTSLNGEDIQEIKALLSRIAQALSGTLIVSPMEAPYRPDSRRV